MPGDVSTAWGVGLAEVQALAPHVTVRAASAPDQPQDPDYGNGTQRWITAAQVAQWITQVSSRVHARRLVLAVRDPNIVTALDTLAADAVANGAAAYLVDAAFPARAGVNDQASYGQVLWARYQSALEEMEAVAAAPGETPAGVPQLPAWSFPESVFPDGTTWR